MKRDILIILALAAIVLLFNLGSGSLSSWDEAFYAQVSREIVQSDNWIDLTWGGGPWADKPPLYMWGTAVFYKLFGVNEFSARLFSALSGIGTAILAYFFAARLFSRRTGLAAAIMMISTYHFIWLSKMGTLDVTFTLFFFLSVYSFLRAGEDRVHIVYSFIWFSLAFLTKGVGAFLIPVILGLYVLAGRQWGMIFNRYTAFGALASLLILGSWYSIAFSHYGRDFFRGHFLQHLVGRTTGTMDGHYGNWLTYLNVVLYKGKPWATVGLIFFPFFIFRTVKDRRPENYLLIWWILVVFLVFSFVKTKLHWYIIPVYPAVVIIAGWAADRFLKRYSTGCVVLISVISVLYFGAKKDIFTLDYNPEIKNLAETIRRMPDNAEGVYIYGVGDPGLKFYLGEFGRNIGKDELIGISGKKGAVIVSESGNLEGVEKRGEIIPTGRAGLTVVKVR